MGAKSASKKPKIFNYKDGIFPSSNSAVKPMHSSNLKIKNDINSVKGKSNNMIDKNTDHPYALDQAKTAQVVPMNALSSG